MLKRLRREGLGTTKISQEAFAEQAGLTQSKVSLYEAGLVKPSLETRMDLFRRFGASIEALGYTREEFLRPSRKKK